MIPTEPYRDQLRHWPATGRHILAQYDDESVIVYQAYRPSIGSWAVEHGALGGPEFSYSRMSWIKPNFLWMMYRSGWGTKPGQETTLALTITRTFFDSLLAAAVESAFIAGVHESPDSWQRAVQRSNVRLQWDPDHDPTGQPQARRALQLGLRGDALRKLGRDALLEVTDVSPLVTEQRNYVSRKAGADLRTPAERVYVPAAPEVCARLRLDLLG
jgi:hypothetical protein